MRRAAPALLLLLLLALPGCKFLSNATGDIAEPEYTSDPEGNLRKGMEALNDKSYGEAEKYFEYVRVKFPFLDAAKEAELRLADTSYQRENFTEARDRYTNFVKLHPLHPKVDYAAFRAAQCHYREIPSDFFILPPSYEKDQAEVRAALQAMSDFLRQYPNSSFRPEAQKMADDAKHRLGEHELYVARFYASRGVWPAVVGRLEGLVTQYPNVGFDEEALFALHDAYLKLHDPARAQDALRRVETRLPNTPAAARARRMLGS